MARPETEAELLRFIRDLQAFIESAHDPYSAADPETVRKATERLATLERELRLAADTIARPDFAEGVRAVLVDKDNRPAWEHASVTDVDVAAVRAVLDEKLPLPR